MTLVNMAVPINVSPTPQEILQQLQRAISQANQQALPSQRVGNPIITTVLGGQGLKTSSSSGPLPTQAVRVQVNTTGSAVLAPKPRESTPVFSYKVRIINPAKKKGCNCSPAKWILFKICISECPPATVDRGIQ